MVTLCCALCSELHEFTPIEAQRAVLALYASWCDEALEEKQASANEMCLRDFLGYPQDQEEYGEYVSGTLEAAYEKAGRDFAEEHENEFGKFPTRRSCGQ